jgi:hypothetical protein
MKRVSTKFQKSIKDITEDIFILKSGAYNKKLGTYVTGKKHNGKHIYSLTLVERETCPTSCFHWDDCYGNHMPFAHRFKTNGLMDKLRQEIPYLTFKHRKGILIRLHVLGDFFSVEYVNFWAEMLQTYPTLAVFGYTAREEKSDMGKAVAQMNLTFLHRSDIRFSTNKEYKEGGNMYSANDKFEGKAFYCPEQLNKVENCATCGLCWTSKKTVKFITH